MRQSIRKAARAARPSPCKSTIRLSFMNLRIAEKEEYAANQTRRFCFGLTLKFWLARASRLRRQKRFPKKKRKKTTRCTVFARSLSTKMAALWSCAMCKSIHVLSRAPLTPLRPICYSCQNWYHIHCVDLPEDAIGLLDQYVCPICAEGEYC